MLARCTTVDQEVTDSSYRRSLPQMLIHWVRKPHRRFESLSFRRSAPDFVFLLMN